MKEKKAKRVVFLDSRKGASAFLADSLNREVSQDVNTLFIAMNPNVFSFLKKQNMWVHNTQPYFSNQSHRNILDVSEKVMDWIRKNSTFKGLALGIVQAYQSALICGCRFSVQYFLSVIEVVSNVLACHEPEKVFCFFSQKRNVSSLYIEPEECYLGAIVKEVSLQRGHAFENITTLKRRGSAFKWGFAKFRIQTLFVLKHIFHKCLIFYLSVQKVFHLRRPIVVTSVAYNMDRLCLELKQKFLKYKQVVLISEIETYLSISPYVLKVLWWKKSKKVRQGQLLLEGLVDAIQGQPDVFKYRNIFFSQFLVQKINDNLMHYLTGYMAWSLDLCMYLRVLNPQLVLSIGNRLDDLIIAEHCKTVQIPTMLISHGSHVGPKNKYEKLEWGEHGNLFFRAPYSHLLLQSPLAEAYLEVFPATSNIIKTGPLIWGTRKSMPTAMYLKQAAMSQYGFDSNTKFVLHAATPKPFNSLRLNVFETSDEYIRSVCEVVKSIERLPNVALIVKFRPSVEIDVETFKTLLPVSKKIIVDVENKLLDVLSFSDLLVSFSSTCIEEALQNNIPVLLYGGGGRYQHVPVESKFPFKPGNKSAVYFEASSANLSHRINQILSFDMKDFDATLFSAYQYPIDERVPFSQVIKPILTQKN